MQDELRVTQSGRAHLANSGSIPSVSARIVVALTAGFLVAAGIHMRYSDAFIAVNGPQMRSDFDHIWFGARAFWDGENPYALIGPGRAFEWAWPLRFPAPALIIASPLVFLPVAIARDAFAGISATVLAFGITRDGWFRLPLLMSAPCLYALIRGRHRRASSRSPSQRSASRASLRVRASRRHWLRSCFCY